jgi:hypothetical protein
LTDPAECIESPLATLAVFEEVPDRLLNQLIGAVVITASEFFLDLTFQICRQRNIHNLFLASFYPLFIHPVVAM